jgi:hypothetical protein
LLEPVARKRARPVLRGDRCSNAAVLPDERWFALLTDKQIRRGVHRNVQALEKDVRAWIADWNDNPGPSSGRRPLTRSSNASPDI